MPLFGDMFSMSLTRGAWRNGDPLQVPTHKSSTSISIPIHTPYLRTDFADPVKVGNAIRLAK